MNMCNPYYLVPKANILYYFLVFQSILGCFFFVSTSLVPFFISLYVHANILAHKEPIGEGTMKALKYVV